MILESMVMINIKIISSLKFAFAKVREDRNKKIIARAPSIHPDINSINSWLLEISHFMLDSYAQVVR